MRKVCLDLPARRTEDQPPTRQSALEAILGMNGPPGHRKILACVGKIDIAINLKMHFNARLVIILKRSVTKSIHWNRGYTLPIDPMEEIEIEGCRYPLRVIIRGQQNTRILDAINADK
jgi:hypothetical protein